MAKNDPVTTKDVAQAALGYGTVRGRGASGGASGPPGIEEQDTRTPLGVPKGYTSAMSHPGSINDDLYFPGQPARYFTGDDFIPSGYAPEIRLDMQHEMEAAGLLDPNTYQPQIWDEPTRSAYRQALSLANASGKSYPQIIGELKENVARYGKAAEAKSRAPLFVTLTNPLDIANVGQSVATRKIGRQLTDQEIAALTASWHQMERQYQSARYAATAEGAAGGEAYTTPDLSSFLESQSKALDPQGASEMTGLHSFDVFNSLLSSSRARLSSLANPVS